MDASSAAALIARNAYGRLVAYLAVRQKDITAAEDALGDAFLKALQNWPTRGVPDNPEAWLLVTARRRLIDMARRSQTQTKALALLNLEGYSTPTTVNESDLVFPDERLKLLFICAHPAIDDKLHTPLMLQTVLGLSAAQIASTFLVAPTTMGQRLVRAKAKIRDAKIPFELPGENVLEARSQAVLQAIYAAYSAGWDSELVTTNSGSDLRRSNLTQEAVWLARLCCQLMPDLAEPKGLLALMLYCESRRAARRTSNGAYVPLSEQNTALWSAALIEEAEHILKQASLKQTVGRFQIEAAIQSTHARRAITQATDWQSLAQLYEGLLQLSPTTGAFLGKAAAIAHINGPTYSLELLDTLPSQTIRNHQPYWALRADLLRQSGQFAQATEAYTQAIGLTEDPAIREFLLGQSQRLNR